LTRLARAARAKRLADERYREAFLFALGELEASGVGDPFSQLARLLGVSRQAVRQAAARMR
jgi:hypothetical protein